MKVIIAGSRTITDYNTVSSAIKNSGFNITTVISGGCTGVDYLGECWAHKNNVPVEIFRPDWTFYGKSAGPIRNKKMVDVADALIAIWNGKSNGTKNVIELAEKKKIPVYLLACK